MKIFKSSLVLVVLGLSLPAFAAVTVKGSKSNSSFRETCNTQACCQQHPGAAGCNGNVLKGTTKVTAPPAPTPVNNGTINNTKANTYKVAGPTPGPTQGPVESTTVKGSHSNSSSYRVEGTPVPTPKPVNLAVGDEGAPSDPNKKPKKPKN
jgi:hypothetical protein